MDLKTNVISAATEKMQCLLHFGLRLVACFIGWAQSFRTTVCLGAFCLSVFSLIPEICSLHWEEERRERGRSCAETSSFISISSCVKLS